MRGKMLGGLSAGILIGAAASMMIMPQMDWRTRRKMDRTSRRIMNSAGSFIHDLKDYSK